MTNVEAPPLAPPLREETVIQIPLTELHPFPNHPFKVRDDEAMRGMLESVREYGVLTPAIVRPREERGYEIIAGHRRKYASEMTGLETMPAIVREMDNDSATILMVDSNIQRENILPSEKAEAYKMKMDAIKRQGKRTDLTSCQVGSKLDGGDWKGESADKIGRESGESARQVHRYIRLTELSPQLQQMVDEKELALNPAVNLSYLKPEEQALVVEVIDNERMIPTLQQSQQLKKTSQESGLDRAAILTIMSPDIPPQAAEQPPAQPPVKDKPPEQSKPPKRTTAEIPKKERPPSDTDTQPKRERKPRIADDILRLKDTTKECQCTPELFLSTFAEYVKRSSREMDAFLMPFYEQIFPALLPEHMDDLRQQIDLIHAAADKFYDQVKGMNERT